MNHVAAAFGYPFRKGAAGGWFIGVLLVLVLPIGLIPLCGYAISAIRASASDPAAGPPAWRSPGRLLAEGTLVAALLLLLSSPFAIATAVLAKVLGPGLRALPGANDPLVAGAVAVVIGVAVVGLPWGILLLVLMPVACIRFADSGRARDLFDLAAAVRRVRSNFAGWNLVAVAIVTAWTAGLAGAGLFCIGVLPGVYFAILASAHATASLK